MNAYESYLNDLISRNKDTFKDHDGIQWINSREAKTYQAKRNQYLANLPSDTGWLFKNTKPWINSISLGCRLCGQGQWSCLFITGQCNARCFYCPATQEGDHIPETQGLKFSSPENYAAYLNFFGFKGCSFSGGEPLLVFDRLLHFLKIIRRNTSPDTYIWMYTNGMAASHEKLKRLADEGLNEIRFNIGATGYSLEKLRLAKDLFPSLTVEIPSIPYNTKKLIKEIPEMIDAGVTHINLHQLRLTPYNAKNLKKRSSIFLHGEAPTVLKSELDALELIRLAGEKGWPLGINYCSFQYKNRFQTAGFRNQIAQRLAGNEKITENGFIRNIYGIEKGRITDIETPLAEIKQWIENGTLHRMDETLLSGFPDKYARIYIDFLSIQLEDGGKPARSSVNILQIDSKSYQYHMERVVDPIMIDGSKIQALRALIYGNGKKIPGDSDLFRIWKYSFIESGIRNYF
jgi:pyruvate formate-lyase activating enzyme-like uncharacterized protein